MSQIINVASPNVRYIAKTSAGDYLLRKSNGARGVSKEKASVFATLAGAKAIAYGIKTPIEIIEIELSVSFKKGNVIESATNGRVYNNCERRIQNIISEHMGIEASTIALDTKFVQDLGLDSLDEIEVVMAIEDEFGIEISDKEAECCRCMQDVLNLLASRNIK
jgi:acyl carrier protein